MTREGLFIDGTAAGAAAYRDAMAAAADAVVDALMRERGATDGTSYATLRERLGDAPAPAEGLGLQAAIAEARDTVMRSVVNVAHPAAVAHLHCPSLIPSLAAEAMLSATNQSLDSFDQAPSATVVEGTVVSWMLDMLGMSRGDGVFTSGGTQSNLMGLMLARDHHARRRYGWDIRRQGIPASAARWRILCSEATHFSVRQAAEVLGLGAVAVLPLPADADGALLPVALDNALRQLDRSREEAMALVLTAGTTETGAIDPLRACTGMAGSRGIWTHVDAAAGGALLISSHRQRLDGIEAADSVALDFHKLLFQPISCGAFFVRDAATLAAMGHNADYLNPSSDDDEGTVNLVSKSLQTSRRFDALKVFLTVRALGTRALAELVDHVVALAAAAAEAIEAHPRLRLIAVPRTSTVLLRWEGGDEAVDDEVNAAAPRRLWDEGSVVLGRGRWRGAQVLRMTFVNPVCTSADVLALVAKVAEVCDALAAQHVSLAGVPAKPDGPGGGPSTEAGSLAEAAA